MSLGRAELAAENLATAQKDLQSLVGASSPQFSALTTPLLFSVFRVATAEPAHSTISHSLPVHSQVLTLSSGLFVLGCRCVAASAGVSDAIVSHICTPALCRALCDAGRRTEALSIASEIDVNTSQLLEDAGFKSVSTDAANAWHCVGPRSSSGVQ
jgi:hypothetical protein